MRSIHSIIIAVIISTCILTGCKQEDPDKKRIEAANTDIQKAAGRFDPSTSVSQANSHIGWTVNFSGNTFIIDTASMSTRMGKLPYLAGKDLPFEVVYRSVDGNILGSYRRNSPLTIQSCDEGGKPLIKKLTSGSFELLLPNIASIASVELKENDSAVGRFRIPVRRSDTTQVKK